MRIDLEIQFRAFAATSVEMIEPFPKKVEWLGVWFNLLCLQKVQKDFL